MAKKMKRQTFVLPDGRQLGYCIMGEGKPVIHFHGTASSCLEVRLLQKLAFTMQLKLIGIDRPGFGLSTFVARANFQDFASDVNLLVESMHYNHVSVLGWSGGGAFALAYVALFPDAVRRAVVAAAPALPFDATTAHNSPIARFAMRIPYFSLLALGRMRSQILKANKNIDGFLESREGKQMLRRWLGGDSKLFSNKVWTASLLASMAEAFRQSNQSLKAILQEHKLFSKPWNVPLSRIPPGKVFIWQGTEDRTCRVDNAFRLAKAIPNAQLNIYRSGHCVLFEKLEDLSAVFS